MTHRQTLIPRAKPSSTATTKAQVGTGRVTHRQTVISRKTATRTANHDRGVPTTMTIPALTEHMATYGASLVTATNTYAAAIDSATAAYEKAREAARTALTDAFAITFAAVDAADRADARMAVAAARILSS